MSSLLQNIFLEINNEIQKLSLSSLDSAKIEENFNLIKNEKEKNDFVKKYEEFWFEHTTLIDLVRSINITLEKMVKLTPHFRGLQNGESKPGHNIHYEYINYYKLLLADLYSLRGLLIGAKIINEGSVSTIYPEIEYSGRIRSAFYQHPEIESSYVTHGIMIIGISFTHILPTPVLGPSGAGLRFYVEYHKSKSGLNNTSIDETLNLNRILLISKKWKNLNDLEKSQIKLGLPPQ